MTVPVLKGGKYLVLAALLTLSGATAAQLLPPLGGGLGQVTRGVDRLGDTVDSTLTDTANRASGLVDRLARTRLGRLDALVRQNPQALEFDARGDPAVKGELIALDAPAGAVAAATAAGFVVVEHGEIEGLGIRSTTLRAPAGLNLAKAEKQLSRIMPGATIQSNPIYQPSGAAAGGSARPVAASPSGPGATIGLIDGGVAAHPTLPRAIVQRGFALGAPLPGDHGTAIASILVGKGAVRGVSPRSRLLVADIYGRDPRGGNALAIARALGWLSVNGAAVVNISLAGPANPLLARAVAATDRRGVLMVAAVGNDGAASPPAFPASYPQVIAVTGVDRRGRALIEAGKAMHLDFAAPGADLIAAKAAGGTARMRGTSFAAPFVAGRLAQLAAGGALPRARAVALLSNEASKGGAARLYARGIVCAPCATR
ncbi:S8 family serine peptidase [Sphingomonas sp. SRS2]|uniref:S8 family serine peptidase n=1 Tax=Sphingomonas sp. SRS2 TaxID=133190 RepID=UPI0006184CC8|nr:S8 family serine peptidase [Sphingomonas sp. SRS2]KKC24749.1 serine protease [Sphingomonas sp. SRS2]